MFDLSHITSNVRWIFCNQTHTVVIQNFCQVVLIFSTLKHWTFQVDFKECDVSRVECFIITKNKILGSSIFRNIWSVNCTNSFFFISEYLRVQHNYNPVRERFGGAVDNNTIDVDDGLSLSALVRLVLRIDFIGWKAERDEAGKVMRKMLSLVKPPTFRLRHRRRKEATKPKRQSRFANLQP